MEAVSASDTPDDLRTRRHRVGISQQALASAAECSLSAIRLFEHGFAPVHSPTRDRVLRVLDELEDQERPAA